MLRVYNLQVDASTNNYYYRRRTTKKCMWNLRYLNIVNSIHKEHKIEKEFLNLTRMDFMVSIPLRMRHSDIHSDTDNWIETGGTWGAPHISEGKDWKCMLSARNVEHTLLIWFHPFALHLKSKLNYTCYLFLHRICIWHVNLIILNTCRVALLWPLPIKWTIRQIFSFSRCHDHFSIFSDEKKLCLECYIRLVFHFFSL